MGGRRSPPDRTTAATRSGAARQHLAAGAWLDLASTERLGLTCHRGLTWRQYGTKVEPLILAGNEYDVPALTVLRLARDSGCSAYDCEYIALAEHLDVKLISADGKLCKASPNRAVGLSEA